MLCSKTILTACKGASGQSPIPGRALARGAIVLALSFAFASPAVFAAGLGRLSVQSALGQPLRAEVDVTSVARDEAGSLAVRLASQAAFQQANLEMNPALSALRFQLDKRSDGSYVVRITSLNPINEPYLDLLLELTWGTGRVFRANRKAFIDNNMNLVLAGRTRVVPAEGDAQAIGNADAHREVLAQGGDFARYKSRLAQAVTGATPKVAPPPPAAVAQGKVTTK